MIKEKYRSFKYFWNFLTVFKAGLNVSLTNCSILLIFSHRRNNKYLQSYLYFQSSLLLCKYSESNGTSEISVSCPPASNNKTFQSAISDNLAALNWGAENKQKNWNRIKALRDFWSYRQPLQLPLLQQR